MKRKLVLTLSSSLGQWPKRLRRSWLPSSDAIEPYRAGLLMFCVTPLILLELLASGSTETFPVIDRSTEIIPNTNQQNSEELGLPKDAVRRLGTTRFQHGAVVNFAAHTADGGLVTADDSEIVHVWNMLNGVETRTISTSRKSGPESEMEAAARQSSHHRGAAPAALSHDGRFIAVHFDPTAIRVFALSTGKETESIDTSRLGPKAIRNSMRCASLAFSLDDKQIAGADLDGSVHVWDREKSRIVFEAVAPKDAINHPPSVRFLPGGRQVIGTAVRKTGKSIEVLLTTWDFISGMEVAKVVIVKSGIGLRNLLRPVLVAENGKYVVISLGASSSILVDALTGKEIGKVSAGQGFAFSNDCSKLFVSDCAAGTGNAVVFRYDAASARLLGKSVHPCNPGTLTNIPGVEYRLANLPKADSVLLYGADHTVQVLDLTSSNRDLSSDRTAVLLAAFSSEASTVVSRNASGAIHVWYRSEEQKPRQYFLPKKYDSKNATLSPNGRMVAVLDEEHAFVCLVDYARDKEITRISIASGDNVQRVAFNADATLIAVEMARYKPGFLPPTLEKIQVQIYEVATGRRLHSCDVATASEAFLFSNVRNVLAAVGVLDVTLVNLNTRAVQTVPIALPGPGLRFESAALSCDGRCLAVSTSDDRIILYEVASASVRRILGERTLFKGSQPVRKMSFAISSRISFAPHGGLLAYARRFSNEIDVWEVDSGAKRLTLAGHVGSVNSVNFSGDGKFLVSGANDGNALVWKLDGAVVTRKDDKAAKVDELDRLWNVLGSTDGVAAYSAILALVRSMDDAALFIEKRVLPVAPVQDKMIEQYIRSLGFPGFKEREDAMERLYRLGEPAVKAIEKALNSGVAAEERQRLEKLRSNLTGCVLEGERLRIARSIEVLERIGSDQSLRILGVLATGEPGSLVTIESSNAISRMKRRY